VNYVSESRVVTLADLHQCRGLLQCSIALRRNINADEISSA
jgi:hypothetical protein